MPDGPFRRALRVVGGLLRASLLTGLQYRSDFVWDGLSGLIRTAATAAPLWLVYTHTDAVLGWDLHDAMVVMVLFLVMNGLIGGLVEPNLGEVVEAVRTGSLDLVLLKPADAQLLVSLRTIAPARSWDLIVAAVLGGWVFADRPAPAPLDAAVAVVLVVAGLVALYGLWLLAICLSFVFVRVDNLRFLLWSAAGAGRWPVTVFADWVRWVLTYAIPVAVLTTFPALALRGDWDAVLVAQGVGVAALFAVGSRWAWRASLARYTSASS